MNEGPKGGRSNTTGVGRTAQEHIALNTLSEREDIEQFITAPTLYCHIFNSGRRQHNNAAFQESVAPEASYAERVRSIERKADTHKKAAHRRISHLRSEIKAIRTSKFNVLLRSSTQEIEGLFKKLGDGGELARFLLLEGYLDDSYYQYTSLFHSGRLSPNDNKFLIQIRAFHTPEPLFPIDNPSEVIAGMREDDFGLNYALNVRLVDALLESEEYKERLGKVFAYLSNEFPNQQEFFEAYYATGLRTPMHPVGHSDNIRSAVPDIRSPRDVATERAFLMSPLVDAVKLFEACDRGAARGAVRAPRRWRGVARGGGPAARHVSFFRIEGPSKGSL